MHHERMIIKKILSELVCFFFRIGIKDFHIDIKDGDEKEIIHIEGTSSRIPVDEVENLKVLLHGQRQDEIEGYYWGLAGENDLHQELTLVGALIDDVDITYDSNNLKVTVYRKK